MPLRNLEITTVVVSRIGSAKSKRGIDKDIALL
jgi:hypothetical protein